MQWTNDQIVQLKRLRKNGRTTQQIADALGCSKYAVAHKIRKSCATKNQKHGMHRTGTYITWQAMHDRCRRENGKRSAAYLGRGIRVCERWSSFVNFFADMGARPEGHTLDRIDPNGHYEPDNCRWATTKQQSNNKRNTRYVTVNGVRMTINHAAETFSIGRSTIAERLKRGWSDTDAATYRILHKGVETLSGGRPMNAEQKQQENAARKAYQSPAEIAAREARKRAA